MISFLFTVGATIATVLFARIFQPARVLHALNATSNKAMHVIQADAISDHWKERVLVVYARRIFVSSCKASMILFAVLAVFLAILAIFASLFTSVEISAHLADPVHWGLSILTAVVTVFFLARR